MILFLLGAMLSFLITYWIAQKKIVELKLALEHFKTLQHAHQEVDQYVRRVAFDALQHSQHLFLDHAKVFLQQCNSEWNTVCQRNEEKMEAKLSPLQESLSQFHTSMRSLQDWQHASQGALKEQLSLLMEAHHALRKETIGLSQALRSPVTRGRWGELHLKRVVELAGMMPYCDFMEQPTSAEGLRPDVIVRLPSRREIVIDAKAPLHAYLDANDTQDPLLKEQKLLEHAKHLQNHIALLSKKSYYEQFAHSIDFVVLFLPGEVFFSAALQKNPSLIELAAEQKVIIATPTTLIALLRAVAYGWKQDQLSQHTQEVASLGKTLYKRIGDLVEHWNKVGKHLQQAVGSYNKSLGVLESKVLVTARTLQEMHLEEQGIPPLEGVGESVRASSIPLPTETT